MAHDPIDPEELKRRAEQKRIADRLAQMQRESMETTRNSLTAQEAGIQQVSDRFDRTAAELHRDREEDRRKLGTESIPALLRQYGRSLGLIGDMASDFKLLLFKMACHKISENINYNDFTPLAATAEAARHARLWLDQNLNTEGYFKDPLPAVFVPYLAEIDDKGILKFGLDVPDAQIQRTDEEKAAFLTRYEPPFRATVEHWIKAVVDPLTNHQLYDIEATAEGPKIFKKIAGVVPPPGPTREYITKEEFAQLRSDVLSPALETYFGVEFKPEPTETPKQAPRI